MTHIIVSPGRNPNNTIVKGTKMDCDDCTGRMVTIITYQVCTAHGFITHEQYLA